jgi:hypothetical protein
MNPWIQKEYLFAATVGDVPFSSGQCFSLKLDKELPYKRLYLFGDVNWAGAGDYAVVADLNFFSVERTSTRVRSAPDEVEQTLQFGVGTTIAVSSVLRGWLDPATAPFERDSIQLFDATGKHALADSVGPANPILLPWRIQSFAEELQYCLSTAQAGTALVNRFYAYVGIYQSAFYV